MHEGRMNRPERSGKGSGNERQPSAAGRPDRAGHELRQPPRDGTPGAVDQLMLAGEGTSMAGRASGPAFPLDTEAMDWIPTGPGKSFRPLRFEAGGWTELMQLERGQRPRDRHPRLLPDPQRRR